MPRTRRIAISALLAMASLAGSAAAGITNCISAVGGTTRTADVSIPQQGGGTLSARVFAPDAALQTSPCPCITMLPGGGAGISSVEWAANLLAREGYIVIITLPASGGSAASYNTAAKSGLDFLASPANPFAAGADLSRVGAAGWSLGARALSRTQEEDPRLDAIVAWDNLAVSEAGDAGSPACTNVPAAIRTPRIPAMGQASDACTNGPESKKTAFNHWRAAGVPSYEAVLAASTHFWWSGNNSSAQEAITHYYTLAWFDRWLKDDPTARARLLSSTPAATPVETLLSSQFFSAAFFDGVNCDDLRDPCCRARLLCAADFNCSGGTTPLSVQDIFDFLAAYFAGDAAADFNHAGGLSVQDVFEFLAAYFGGCG